MPREPNQRLPVHFHSASHPNFAAWSSPGADDRAWDEFLQGTALGHFQQASSWARAKLSEGWQSHRRVVTVDGRLAGGFQILARRTRFGSVGYVYKGPVALPEIPGLSAWTEDLLVSTARDNLRALIVQQPDATPIAESLATKGRLLPNHLVEVIAATLVVDLSSGMEAVGRRFRKNTWVEIRQAQRRGATVREGSRADVTRFFQLMIATCQRQNTPPIPASEAALLAVWDALYAAGGIKLLLVECEGEITAGALCLPFGTRVTMWKKGWSGSHRERHPNTLLTFAALQWAQQAGYQLFDFAAVDENLADTLIKGLPLSDQQKSLRDMFHLGFGGQPVRLPTSRVYIGNPLARAAYRLAGSQAIFRKLVLRRLNKLASG